MAYRMVQLPMTSSDAEVTFAVLNLCNTHNAGNIACFNNVCLHTTCKAHLACALNFIVKGERFLKVAGNHWKSANISETVLNRDAVTTGH